MEGKLVYNSRYRLFLFFLFVFIKIKTCAYKAQTIHSHYIVSQYIKQMSMSAKLMPNLWRATVEFRQQRPELLFEFVQRLLRRRGHLVGSPEKAHFVQNFLDLLLQVQLLLDVHGHADHSVLSFSPRRTGRCSFRPFRRTLGGNGQNDVGDSIMICFQTAGLNKWGDERWFVRLLRNRYIVQICNWINICNKTWVKYINIQGLTAGFVQWVWVSQNFLKVFKIKRHCNE